MHFVHIIFVLDYLAKQKKQVYHDIRTITVIDNIRNVTTLCLKTAQLSNFETI